MQANVCPAQLGPLLLERVRSARRDIPSAVVLATHEFEAWFLAALESLRGTSGMLDTAVSPPNPEGIRGAKEWLTRHMSPRQRYSEVLHQPAFAAGLDMSAAKRADSFEKLYRDVARLLVEGCA